MRLTSFFRKAISPCKVISRIAVASKRAASRIPLINRNLGICSLTIACNSVLVARCCTIPKIEIAINSTIINPALSAKRVPIENPNNITKPLFFIFYIVAISISNHSSHEYLEMLKQTIIPTAAGIMARKYLNNLIYPKIP